MCCFVFIHLSCCWPDSWSGSFVVVLCNTWYRVVSKSAFVQSTASVEHSTWSTLSTLTRIRSPWSDHACIHKCSSAMKFLGWPLSWLPSQLFGINSLILYGLADSAGPAESLCMALAMMLIASSLPLIAVCITSRTRCKESAISCLICCCNVMKSLWWPPLLAVKLCDCTCDGA